MQRTSAQLLVLIACLGLLTGTSLARSQVVLGENDPTVITVTSTSGVSLDCSNDTGGGNRRGNTDVRPNAAATELSPVNPEEEEEEAIRAILDRYEDAYASMDIKVLRGVWPSMTREQEKAVRNGWHVPGLQAVKVRLLDRAIYLEGDKAKVTSVQSMVYTWRGERKPPQTNPVEILLVKNAQGNWLVDSVKGR